MKCNAASTADNLLFRKSCPGRVAQLGGVSSCTQKVVGSIPSQGTYLGCQFYLSFPIRACMGGNQSQYLSLSLSLSQINKHILR